jgi:L,D-transpeptidase YcbB
LGIPAEARRIGQIYSVDKIIYLPAPLTIQIGFFTAWVNENGVLQFRPDIYQLDKEAGKPEPVAGLGAWEPCLI